MTMCVFLFSAGEDGEGGAAAEGAARAADHTVGGGHSATEPPPVPHTHIFCCTQFKYITFLPGQNTAMN